MNLIWECQGEYNGIKSIYAFSTYCVARARKAERDITYKVYVTDALKLILERLGVSMGTRYYDTLHLKPEETRSSEEIISDIKGKLANLRGEKNESV